MTLTLERPNIIDLTWNDVKLDANKPFLKVGKRELELFPLLISCFKLIKEEHNKEKIKGAFVFSTFYNGKYRPFTESTVNGVFNKLIEINEDDKWSYFSPQYVRTCLVRVLFDNGYSMDEIIYLTGIDLKNIYRYIATDEVIERRKKNPKGIKVSYYLMDYLKNRWEIYRTIKTRYTLESPFGSLLRLPNGANLSGLSPFSRPTCC